MNRQEYYTLFAESLRLGGSRRDNVCAELMTHLYELPDEHIEQIMGKPQTLAHAYNVRHLGPWRGVSWMFLTPIIAWFLIIGAWARLQTVLQSRRQFRGCGGYR